MNKKIILITIILGLTIGLVGCKEKKLDNVKRVVIEDDVSMEDKEKEKSNLISFQNNRTVKNVKVSKPIELLNDDYNYELPYFYPTFYCEGEIYGYVSHEETAVKKGAWIKYLYKIDKNNNLIKTSKEYYDGPLQGDGGYISIGYGINGTKAINIIEDKVYVVDYTKKDKPEISLELTEIVNKLKGDSTDKLYLIDYINENYLVIDEQINTREEFNKIKSYIYDMENKKLYTMKEGERSGDAYYVDALQSLIWVDHKDFKIYKIVLNKEYYDLEEYIDLNIYGKGDQVRTVMNGNDEILLFMNTNISQDRPDIDMFLVKTNYIGKFNFRTNQYNLLFEAPRDVNIYAGYIGHDILLIEEFKIDKDSHIKIPVKRYLNQIRNNEMNIIFEEEFEDESAELYPNHWTLINGDGREIFSVRFVTKREKSMTLNREMIKDKAIYQKYYIKY
ncbi:hypothetical protein [Tissierella praeacuta]|uniref:hypothetical protein n=1 Tax=Tissierella praeacuta TaxID=43131 RepID=UPI001C126DD4|nr:hypothetical protein [Tissierella praeacuta]MBU5255110.1 hypothetical protein [Tissierella praeacuta]